MLTLTGHLQGMFYDLKTQLVQFTDGKSSWKLTIYKLHKKSEKSIGESEINFW